MICRFEDLQVGDTFYERQGGPTFAKTRLLNSYNFVCSENGIRGYCRDSHLVVKSDDKYWLSSEPDGFLAAGKYQASLDSIYQGLGIPKELV